MRGRFVAAVLSVVGFDCQAPAPQLTLSARPARIDNNGQVCDVTATATMGDGSPGKGEVKFSSMTGSLVTPETWPLDATTGSFTTGFSCDVALDPGCISEARVIAEWQVVGTTVLADRHITFTTGAAGGTGGSGGGGGTGGGSGTGGGTGTAGGGASVDPFCNATGTAVCYHFNEGSGTTIHDSSPHNRNCSGTGIHWDAGTQGTSLQLDLGSDVSANESSDYELGSSFAVTVDVFPATTAQDQWVINNGSWALALTSGPGNVCFIVETASGQVSACSTDRPLVSSQWKQVTGTWDGTTLRLYVGSFLEASTTATSPVTKSQRLVIGFKGTGGFIGLIDDLRISHP